MEDFERLTFKSLLEKLIQFIIKPRRPKVTKTQKTTTIKLNKTPSSNKISQRVSPPVQIKQVEHKQQQKNIANKSFYNLLVHKFPVRLAGKCKYKKITLKLVQNTYN